VRKPGPLINRNFALLWSGAAISYTGDFIYLTTLTLWIATAIGRGQAWAPLAVSGLVIAASLPVLLIGPLAGVFVDRWDKRRVMLAMDAARAVLIALLPLAANLVPLPLVPGGRLTPFEQIGAIYSIVFLAAACAQFFNPGRMAIIGDIVPEASRSRATGLMQTVQALAIVIGPALAAPLFFAAGVEWALLINAASFLASFGAVLAVRAPRAARSVAPGARGSVGGEFWAGLRFFASNRILMTLLVTISLFMLGGGALNTLDIFFVTQNLHTAPRLYGNLEAVFGIGSLVGALLATFIAARLKVARTFWICALLVGILFVVYSRLTNYFPALVLLFLIGVPSAALNAVVGPMIYHVTPRAFLGRVSAILNPAATLAELLSAALAGYLDGSVLSGFHMTVGGIGFGAVDTIFAGAGVLVVMAAFYARAGLGRLRLAGEPGAAPEPGSETPATPPAELAPVS
jgi:predicted MFS family arabinose efflux permease